MIDIGNGEELGASRTINLDHNHRDRNSDNKGNSNINRDLRSSNISNRDNSNRDNSNKDKLRRESTGRRDNLRFSSQDHNLRRKVSGHRNKSEDLRLSNQNTLSLKEDLKAGRDNVESRMTKREKGALYNICRLEEENIIV